MIVLGISLLRMGDLVLQRPLIEGLRKMHPQSEIHLLVNKQFAQVEFLFEGLVDRFIYFDRESLQKSCGEQEYNILWGYHQLKNLVEEINRSDYEAVYNFTHNRLSAHLMGLISAHHRVGIYSLGGQFYGLSNPWIQFFNSYFGQPEATGFHYTELLARAMGIPLKQRAADIKWRRVAGKKTVVIQALTSDSKKNWELDKFQSLVKILEQKTPFAVKVLGAPFEQEALGKVFADKNLFICDFKGAAMELKDAVLLITGDTSVKHLGALYDVPILELALGSSQPLQVGAYSNNSVILQSRVACGPCPHSKKCSEPTHACGEIMSTAAVYEAARVLLNLDPPDWASFANKYPELNTLKTEIRDIMGWTVQCLSLTQKNQFDEILQKKTMIVQELNRRSATDSKISKGVSHEQRTGKLSVGGAEAS
jgi:ADP-heptose:LPS heptosyltransferase